MNDILLQANRLRMLHILSKRAIKDLYDGSSISVSTIEILESGRIELTKSIAEKICSVLAKKDVIYNPEWLATGDGDLYMPIGSVKNPTVPQNNEDEYLPTFPQSLSVEIKEELNFFINLHKNVLFHVVEKNFKDPYYRKGDCVAGIIEHTNKLVGKTIIAQLADKEIIICKLLCYIDEESEIFTLDESNKKVKIERAAKIIWHRIPF